MPGKKQPESRRGQNRTQRVSLLQDAGERAAPLLGQRLKHQRRAHAPFTAHRNPEKSAQYQKRVQRRRKGAGQLDHREAENVEHQHRPAAIAIGQHAKKQRAHRPKSLCQKHRSQNRRWLGPELAGNRLHAKNQQKKVKTVERPTQKCSRKSMALRAGQPSKVVRMDIGARIAEPRDLSGISHYFTISTLRTAQNTALASAWVTAMPARSPESNMQLPSERPKRAK